MSWPRQGGTLGLLAPCGGKLRDAGLSVVARPHHSMNFVGLACASVPSETSPNVSVLLGQQPPGRVRRLALPHAYFLSCPLLCPGLRSMGPRRAGMLSVCGAGGLLRPALYECGGLEWRRNCFPNLRCSKLFPCAAITPSKSIRCHVISKILLWFCF